MPVLIIRRLQCKMNPFLKNFLFLGRNRKADSSEHTVVLPESHKGCARKPQGLCPKVIRVVPESHKSCGQTPQDFCGKTTCFTAERPAESAHTYGRIGLHALSYRAVRPVSSACLTGETPLYCRPASPLSPHHRARTADVTTAIANPSPCRHPAVITLRLANQQYTRKVTVWVSGTCLPSEPSLK